MGAAAERWYEDEATDRPDDDEHGRRLRPMEGEDRPEFGPVEAGEPSGSRWNVLAEELVAYPPRSQRIWLDEPAAGDRSRTYANAWLDQELESLRTRRSEALSRSDRRQVALGAGRTSDVGRPLPHAASSSHGEALVGDPGTVARPATAPRDRLHSSRPSPRRRAHVGELVAASSGTRAAILGPRGLRRLLPGAATLAVLVATWFGVGAMATSAHATSVVPPAGSVATAQGYVYFARPGDTLWTIASQAEPGADPRPLVDRLQAQLGGRSLQPGDRLVLPRTPH